MQKRAHSIRSKLVILATGALAIALAAPVASARGHYYHGGSSRGADVVGALIVGAVIGGALASANQGSQGYYDGGYYAPPQAYPPPPAYYPPPAPVYYQPYPAYPQPAYGGGVSLGVVYSSGGGRRWGDSGRGRGERGHYYQRYGR